MRLHLRFVAAAAVTTLCLAAPTIAQLPMSDGTIVEQVQVPEPSYDEFIEMARKARGISEQVARAFTPKERFDRIVASAEWWRITYLSSGDRVNGYLIRPTKLTKPKYPLFIYVAGDSPAIDARRLYLLSTQTVFGGQVVLLTDHKTAGGPDRSQYGGAEVKDVMNLLPVARSMGFVDTSKAAAYGAGLGALRILVALSQGMPLTTAIVMDAPTDLALLANEKPQVRETMQRLVPGFAKGQGEAIRSRSAVHWPERINVPLLIFHGQTGRGDAFASPMHSLALAQRLQQLGRPYKLVIYDQSLTAADANKDVQVREWLAQHGLRSNIAGKPPGTASP